MTIKQLTAEAKQFGINRARGTYNGQAYWTRGTGIITRAALMKILGY